MGPRKKPNSKDVDTPLPGQGVSWSTPMVLWPPSWYMSHGSVWIFVYRIQLNEGSYVWVREVICEWLLCSSDISNYMRKVVDAVRIKNAKDWCHGFVIHTIQLCSCNISACQYPTVNVLTVAASHYGRWFWRWRTCVFISLMVLNVLCHHIKSYAQCVKSLRLRGSYHASNNTHI